MGINGRHDYENIYCFRPTLLGGKWEFPVIKGIPTIDETSYFTNSELLRKNKDYNSWCMFYEYDYKFTRMWQQPKRQAKWLSNFKGSITPNFSVYMDTPLALQLWSIYKNRWLGAYWESLGIKVIPNITCGDERTYEFAFDGIPKNIVLSINNMGCMRDRECRQYCYNKLDLVLNRLEPSLLLIYGADMGINDSRIKYINKMGGI